MPRFKQVKYNVCKVLVPLGIVNVIYRIIMEYHISESDRLFNQLTHTKYPFMNCINKSIICKRFNKVRRIISNILYKIPEFYQYKTHEHDNGYDNSERAISREEWSDDDYSLCSGYDCDYCNRVIKQRTRILSVIHPIVNELTRSDLNAIYLVQSSAHGN
jgi:hypothetical protein